MLFETGVANLTAAVEEAIHTGRQLVLLVVAPSKLSMIGSKS
jgi:hypothetical protein